MSQTKSMARLSVLALTAAALLNSVLAHMEIESPPPLRSRFNKYYDYTNTDYSMTSPLLPDGSNFPCKGYASDVGTISQAVDTLTAGQQYTVKLAGTATHRGGSCQISLSYDGGKTFGVVHSVIGGCPLSKQVTFTVPSNVPAGKNVLLSWSWFNLEGNREMYQNCAAVDIRSPSTAPLKVPRIFEANIFGAGQCNTIEGNEVVFPNPGSSVEYGGTWAGKTPSAADLQLANCPNDIVAAESSFVTLSANAAAGGSETTPASESKSPPAATSSVKPPASSPVVSTTSSKASSPLVTGEPSTEQSAVSTPATVPSSSPSPSCSEGSLTCSGDGESFSMCSHGKLVDMGSVAPGTLCKDGQIVLAPTDGDAACSPNTLKCSADGKTFSLCNASGQGYTNMGEVAPGTICVNGAIVLDNQTGYTSSRKRERRHVRGKRALRHERSHFGSRR